MALHEYPALEQGSDEWLEQRRGMVTASVVGQLLTIEAPGPIDYFCSACKATAGNPCMSLTLKKPAPIKTFHGPRTQWASDAANVAPKIVKSASNDTSRRLTLSLVAERITGCIEPVWVNDDMLRGQLDEPIARDLYQEHFAEGEEVATTGLMVRDFGSFKIGASPDGLVGDKGGLEIKCPRAKGHIATILADAVPTYHMAQVQASLLVSGRDWWDFMSYHGGLKPYVTRVHADPKWHEAIVDAVAAFEQSAEVMVHDYLERTADLPDTERRVELGEIQVA